MGHNMFVSWVLKIPPAARFPVWEVSLHFQKEVRGFSSVRLSIPNTQNDWTKLGTGKTNTFCAKPMTPRCKLEAQKIISCSSCPSCSPDFCPYQSEMFLFFIVKRGTETESCYTETYSLGMYLLSRKYINTKLNLVFREVFWRPF